MTASLKKFEECVEKVSYGAKIQRINYLKEGKYPVVSQESALINGFWNEESDVFIVDRPVIVFGDHTRALKYIDFSFVLGADGAKIIKPKNFLVSKFFYYFLMANPIEGKGYARHYRFLKELTINVPSLAKQQEIVGRLDAIFAEIDRATVATEANVKNAEALFQSYLTEVFEPNPSKNFIELNEVLLKTKNVNPEKNQESYFKYVDVSSISNTSFEITDTQYLLGKDAPSRAKKHIQENDILFATVRPTLKRVAIVPSDLNNEVASTGYVVLRAGDELRTKYLFYYLLSSIFMEKMSELQRGASYPAVTDNDVKNQKINLLSLTEQDSICSKLDSIFSAKKSIEQNHLRKISELDLLKKSILKQAFNGELVKE